MVARRDAFLGPAAAQSDDLSHRQRRHAGTVCVFEPEADALLSGVAQARIQPARGKDEGQEPVEVAQDAAVLGGRSTTTRVI